MLGGKWSTKYKKSINCKNQKVFHKNNIVNMEKLRSQQQLKEVSNN